MVPSSLGPFFYWCLTTHSLDNMDQRESPMWMCRTVSWLSSSFASLLLLLLGYPKKPFPSFGNLVSAQKEVTWCRGKQVLFWTWPLRLREDYTIWDTVRSLHTLFSAEKPRKIFRIQRCPTDSFLSSEQEIQSNCVWAFAHFTRAGGTSPPNGWSCNAVLWCWHHTAGWLSRPRPALKPCPT